MSELKELTQIFKKNNKENDLGSSLIKKAWEFASVAHQNQKRLSGEEYITHPMKTAIILAEWDMDIETIIAGILHDVPEETEFTISNIKSEFGSEIAKLVEGDTKIGHIKYRGVERYAENLRKMFIAMSRDVRVIIIRFADRIHNLKTLQYHPNPQKRYRIALESLEIYAPIAGRLGMYKIKEQIEDLSFKYVYPLEKKWTIEQLKSQLETRTISLKKIRYKIIDLLEKNDINFIKVYGRKKKLYSLYKKLLRKEKDIYKIYDLIALRIITNTKADCYTILGLIHNNWQPLNGRVKDFISQPKPNGYQSLHTTILNEDHNPIEIQIKTQAMEKVSEFGIAAHWRYKDKKIDINKKEFSWMKDLVKWQQKIKNNKDYLKSIKLNTDIFKSCIFVFTPKNDVIELPERSTPIDFAYHIHTDVGNKCIGVKINNKMSKVNTELKNGDLVEILMDKNRKLPNPDWLNFIRTNTAKEKIKNTVSRARKEKNKNFIKRIKGYIKR